MTHPKITFPFETPTEDDAMTVALRAQLCDVSLWKAAQEYLSSLPSDHPMLHNQVARMVFQTRLSEAAEKLLQDYKATHS